MAARAFVASSMVLADASPITLHTGIAYSIVLADASPMTLHTGMAYSMVLADASPITLHTSLASSIVLADPGFLLSASLMLWGCAVMFEIFQTVCAIRLHPAYKAAVAHVFAHVFASLFSLFLHTCFRRKGLSVPPRSFSFPFSIQAASCLIILRPGRRQHQTAQPCVVRR